MQRCRWGRLLRHEGGGVSVEFAIISVALVLLSLGTIEFGRALEVRNQLAFVADIAARLILNDSTVSEAAVEARIREVFDASNPDLLQVEIDTETIDDVDYRTVLVSYPFMLLIPQLSSEAITLRADQLVPIT